MGEKTKKRKRFMRICALVVVGMFVLTTSMSVPADDVDDWTRWGDNADPTWVLGTLNPQDLRIITAGSQKMVVTTGGQVGIGTPGPTSMLEVRGSGTSPATSAFRVNDGLDTGLFFVRDDGNIGIGTLDPSCTLHIKELTPGAETILALESESPSIIPGDHLGTIMFMGPYSGSVGAMIRAEATGAFVDVDPNVSPTGLQFYTQDATSGPGLLAPRMVIDMNGNVGIGTTIPETKLEVLAPVAEGGATITTTDLRLGKCSDASGPGIIGYYAPGGNAATIEFPAGENELNILGGNVGIGTTDPDNKLHIFAGSAGAASSHHSAFLTIENSAWAYMQFLTPNTGFQGILFGDPESSEAGYIEYCHGENSMRFNVNGDRAIFIDNQRRVGIGTTSPDEELHVVGNIKMVDGNQGAGKVLTSDANGVGTWQEPQVGIGGSGTTNYIPKFTDSTTLGNSIIYESPSGNIGIGTTNPANLLDVYEANPAPGADAVVSIRSADSNAYLKFSKGGATYSSWLQFDDPGQEGRWMMGQLGGTYDFVIYSSAVNPFLKLDYDTGNVGIGTVSPTGRLDVNGNDIRIRQPQTPSSSSADGYTGEIAWDQNAIYVCTNGDGPGGGTDTWKRASISIW